MSISTRYHPAIPTLNAGNAARVTLSLPLFYREARYVLSLVCTRTILRCSGNVRSFT